MGSLRTLATKAYQEEQVRLQAEIEEWNSIRDRISLLLETLYKRKNRKILAIKLLRQVSGAGLKEAKDTIEEETWDEMLTRISVDNLHHSVKHWAIDLKQLEIDFGIKHRH